jgi:hypothetical protein
MPIDEIINFRQKYPQYDDLDDLTLAKSIAQKWPVYKDLVDKVSAEQSPNYLKKGAELALRIGPSIVGGLAFGIPGAAAGAGLGEAAAQLISDEPFNLKQIGLATGLGAIPGMKFAGVTSPLARVGVRAAEGAAFGAGSTAISGAVEGRKPTWSDIGTGALFGGALGGGLQSVSAVRNLFKGARTSPDAPAGLTEEVFGPRQTIELPGEAVTFPSDIGPGPARQSAGAFEQAFREGRTPTGAQGLSRRLSEEQVLSSLSQYKPFTGPPRPPTLPEFPSDIGFGPARQSAEAMQAAMLGQERLRQSPFGQLMLGKQVRSQSGPPEGAIPLRPEMPADWADTGEILRQRIARGGPLSDDQRTALTSFVNDPRAPRQIKTLSSKLLQKLQPPIEMPPSFEPPSFEAPPPPLSVPTGGIRIGQGKKGAVADVDRDMASYIRAYMKGINPGALQEEFKSAAGKQGFRFLSPKGRAYDEAAEELFQKGYLSAPTADALQDAIRRSAAGQRIFSSQGQRAQAGTKREAERLATREGDDLAIAAIEGETNPGNLASLLQNVKDPNSPVAIAALKKYHELHGVGFKAPEAPELLHINDPSIDDTLRGLLQSGQYGKGPLFGKQARENAEIVANKIRPNPNPLDDINVVKASGAMEAAAGVEPPTFQRTAAGQQGMIPGAEGRNVPRGGVQPGRRQTEELTDLERASIPETQGSLLDPTRVGPRGGAPVGGPGGSPTNSVNDDMGRFFSRIGRDVESFRNVELKDLTSALTRRTMAMQELVRKFPEIKPTYDAFHEYPIRAGNGSRDAAAPLLEQEGRRSYIDLHNQNPEQRLAIDKLLSQQKVHRQGQPRMTHEQMRQTRGFTEEMAMIADDVLDYGQGLLKTGRDWYVERGLPVLMKTGMSEQAARATLDAEAQKALQGMDHWVPFWRSGDKTVLVTHPSQEKPVEFRMEPNIKSRAETAAQLRQQYPAERGYVVKEGTMDYFVRSKAFDEIDLASLEILSKFAKVDPTIADEFMAQIRPTLLGKSDAMARQIKFENIPGFKEDLREGLFASGRGLYNYIERQRAKIAAGENLAQLDPRKQPELYNFTERYIRDNLTPGDKRLQQLRDWTYTYSLGFSPKQGALQLTQFPTVVIPELLKYGTFSEVASVGKTASRWAFARDLTKAPEELQNYWREMFKQRAIQPRAEMYTGETLGELVGKDPLMSIREYRLEHKLAQQMGSFETKTAHNLKNLRNWAMIFTTDADMRTRFGAGTAFYELGRKKGMSIPEATKFGIEETNRTNGLYGRAESPQLFGRTDLPLFASMFKTWPANYISFLRGIADEASREATQAGARTLGQRLGKMGTQAVAGPGPARTLATSIASMFALGGVLYQIPGPLRVALEQGLGINPETAMREFLTDKAGLPEMATDVALRGVGALAGVDMSRSLALGDTLPTSFADVLGPTPSMITTIGKGAGQLFQSATQPFGPSAMDALELMSGAGLKNVLKAARLGTEGITTKGGGKLPGTEGLREIDPALQALGFTPLAVAKAKAMQRAMEIGKQFHRDQQSEVYERLGRAIIADDQASVGAITSKIQEINQAAMEQNRPDLIINIDRSQLRQRIAEMTDPRAALKRQPKAARQRYLELQELYGGGPPEPPR